MIRVRLGSLEYGCHPNSMEASGEGQLSDLLSDSLNYACHPINAKMNGNMFPAKDNGPSNPFHKVITEKYRSLELRKPTTKQDVMAKYISEVVTVALNKRDSRHDSGKRMTGSPAMNDQSSQCYYASTCLGRKKKERDFLNCVNNCNFISIRQQFNEPRTKSISFG